MKKTFFFFLLVSSILLPSCDAPIEDGYKTLVFETSATLCLYRKDSSDIFYTKDKDAYPQRKSISSVWFTTMTKSGKVEGFVGRTAEQTDTCLLLKIGGLSVDLDRGVHVNAKEELLNTKQWNIRLYIRAYNGSTSINGERREIIFEKDISFPAGNAKTTHLGDFLVTFKEDLQ
tara:strand:- start:49 stop:570 length:522 start_codon:yes stop_codon:yes gene_type:complete